MGDDKVTEWDIQSRLSFDYYSNASLMALNIYWRYGEMDFFLLRPSGYAEEFEIKLTKSDFRADRRKKYKHQCYKELQNNGHPNNMPNRFSYVVPSNIGITVHDVPSYAGLYYYTRGFIERQKQPPLLHKTKHVDLWTKLVAKTVSFKYIRLYRNYVKQSKQLLELYKSGAK